MTKRERDDDTDIEELEGIEFDDEDLGAIEGDDDEFGSTERQSGDTAVTSTDILPRRDTGNGE